MGENSIKSSFFARRAKKASAEGRSPPQELEVGLRSGPYLLVCFKEKKIIMNVLIKLELTNLFSINTRHIFIINKGLMYISSAL